MIAARLKQKSVKVVVERKARGDEIPDQPERTYAASETSSETMAAATLRLTAPQRKLPPEHANSISQAAGNFRREARRGREGQCFQRTRGVFIVDQFRCFGAEGYFGGIKMITPWVRKRASRRRLPSMSQSK
jgi:hypothetical protein